MADTITRCIKTSDENGDALQWDISYTVENNSKINDFCVTILASELTNPESGSEVKTKANVKAKAIKDKWIAEEIQTAASVDTVLGTVTL